MMTYICSQDSLESKTSLTILDRNIISMDDTEMNRLQLSPAFGHTNHTASTASRGDAKINTHHFSITLVEAYYLC